MLYVIPFIILLVVAIVLKKRDASKEQDTNTPVRSNKKSNKKTAVKSNKTTKIRSKTTAIEETAPQSTPVPEALRHSIEQLFQQKNFNTAEAQINQALKRDNTQHELYLYLLDLHLLQKDEFAVQQLISHIRSLMLDDILVQAEEKYAEYETQKQANLTHTPVSPSVADEPSTNTPFDVLAVTSSAETSFDELQTTYVSAPQQPAPEIEPLEFNFSLKETAGNTPEIEQVTPEPQSQDTSTETTEPAPLEFSFSLSEKPATDTESTPALVVSEPTSEIKNTVASEPELKLDLVDFSLEPQTTEISEVATKDEPSASMSFEPEEIVLDKTTTPAPLLIEEEAPTPSETTSTIVADSLDPFIQAFPELEQLDENELDLKLAEQYIKLGVYESARALLEHDEQKFNTEQQQRAKNLLNRIAS